MHRIFGVRGSDSVRLEYGTVFLRRDERLLGRTDGRTDDPIDPRCRVSLHVDIVEDRTVIRYGTRRRA